MLRKVTGKQPNSRMCLVCGMKNSFGLHTAYYELDNDELLAVFLLRSEHQSYPGRLHGGIISTILDETIGRAIMMHSVDEVWGVTVDLQIRFKKPVPLDEELKVVGRITKDSSRFFKAAENCCWQTAQLRLKGTAGISRQRWKKLLVLTLNFWDGRLSVCRKTRMKLICNYFGLIHRPEDQNNHKIAFSSLAPIIKPKQLEKVYPNPRSFKQLSTLRNLGNM